MANSTKPIQTSGVNCQCETWCRECRAPFAKHHRGCKNYNPEAEGLEAIKKLLYIVENAYINNPTILTGSMLKQYKDALFYARGPHALFLVNEDMDGYILTRHTLS